MATANFRVKNARAIYAVHEAEDVISRREIVEETFPYLCDKWAERDTRVLCETDDFVFSYGKNDMLSLLYHSELLLRAGYYEGENYDFDICLCYDGQTFRLSEYDTEDDFISDIIDVFSENVRYYGHHYGWNAGLFACHKNKIQKRLEKIVQAEIEKCEKACAKLCDEKLFCVAVFSNGEAFYQKAN